MDLTPGRRTGLRIGINETVRTTTHYAAFGGTDFPTFHV
jgi:hypothetical protein